MTKTVNTNSLNRAAEQYSPVLTMLPYLVLEPQLAELGIRLLEVKEKDIHLDFMRKGAVSKPYSSSDDPDDLYVGEVGKIVERPLEVKPCVLPLKDHIMNYRDKKVISNTAEGVNNQTKKHPIEKLILETAVTTVSEDSLIPLFPGERNEANKTPLGMYDGIDTIIDTDIANGDITTAKGNLINLGASAFIAPDPDDATTQKTAWNSMLKFLRALDPFLRRQGFLYLPDNIAWRVMDSLGYVVNNRALEWDVFLGAIKGLGGFNGKIIRTDLMGTGDRIMCSAPNNIDFGLNTKSDQKFVQVRDPFEDPNWVQFWIQWDAGMRIKTVHRKKFAINNGTPVGDSSFAGDYQS